MPSRDYEEFIAASNAHGVRYLISGGHAAAFHATPRATNVLDVLVERTDENALSLLAALREFFGGADLGYSVEDMLDPDWVLQLGVAPVRIDILGEVPGIDDFGAAWRARVQATFGDVPANYLGLGDLIRSKESAGRRRDLDDVDDLRRRKPTEP